MRFLSAWKYHLAGIKWPLIIFYSVMAALLVLMGISLTVANRQNIQMSAGGLEMASIIFVFIVGLNSFSQAFLMFSANGVSRKTMFLSFLAMLGVMAAGMAVIDSAYGLIMKTAGNYQSMFEQMYGFRNTTIIGGFLWRFCSYLAAGMTGYLITTLYYRMNKPVKLLVSIGVPVLLLIGMPALDNALWGGAVSEAAGRFFAWSSGVSTGSPGLGMISDIVFSVVLGMLSYITLRRAPVKTKTS